MGIAVPLQPFGRQQVETSNTTTMNRFVTLFALVAAAFAEPEANAEADPQLLVYGNAHTSAGLVHHPASGAVVPDETLSVKAAKHQHLTAKFGLPLAYSAPHFVAAQPAVIAKPVVAKPVVAANTVLPYTALPLTYNYQAAYPYTHYSHIVHKREAEAEAEADPALYYNNAYSYPYTARYASYYPSTKYTYPTYATGYTAKTVLPYTAPVVTAPVVTAAKTVLPYTYNYPTYTTGTHHLIHKREAEAEAEADPYTFYSNAFGHNYGLPYTTGYTGYSRYPYTYSTVAAYPGYNSAYTYPYAARYHY